MTPTKEKILLFVDEALAQASDLAEEWAGTLAGRLIDIQQAQLIKAVEKEKYDDALRHLGDLAMTINYVEELNIEG